MNAIVAEKPALLAPVYMKTILALALGLRLVVVAMVLFFYPPNWLFSKAPDLGFLAHSLSSGHGLSSPFGGSTGPTAFLAPGYPAILGLLFHLFGSYSFAAAAAIIGLQTSFAILTVALVIQVAHRLFGVAAANLAGLFWAISPPLLWLPVVLWETSLSTLLLIGMVALVWQVPNQTGKKYWIALGLYSGLAMLVNPSLTVALCVLPACILYQGKSQNGRALRYEVCLGLLALFCVYAPWPVRNAYALHAFIPLRSNFGYELWQGNHAGGSGFFDANLEPLKNTAEYTAYASQGEIAYMRHKTRLAQAFIRGHPAEFLRLTCGRMLRFWTGAGSETNSAAIELHAMVTSALGWIGLAVLYRKHRARAWFFLPPLLVFPLPYYLTHPDFRFRLVLDPVLTILSAYAITQLDVWWKKHRSA